MTTVYPYCFEDGQTTFHGTCSIKKLQKSYHDNYDYFQVYFLEGTIFIKDVYQNKIYEESFQKIKSVVALKKRYLQEECHVNTNEICFTSRNRTNNNQYEVMVVHADIEKKLTNKNILNWILQDAIKNIFIGNEKYLLTIT